MKRATNAAVSDDKLAEIFKAGRDPEPVTPRLVPPADGKTVAQRRRAQLRAMLQEYGFDPEQDAITLGFAVTQMAFVLMDLDEKMERVVKVLEERGK